MEDETEMKREQDNLISIENVSLDQSDDVRNESMVERKDEKYNKNRKNDGKYYFRSLSFSAFLIIFVVLVLVIVIKNNNVDKNEQSDMSKGIVIPIDIKIEEKNDGRGFVVLRAIDYATDGESFPFLKSKKNMQEMKDALKSRIGLAEGAITYAYNENKGIAYRLLSPNFMDSCTFYYEKEEVGEIYHRLFEVIDDELEKGQELDRYEIGDYSISIPETMFLSDDKDFDIKYNFKPKDDSKYARIQVKIEQDDYADIDEMLRNGERFCDEEVEYLYEYLMEELTSTGLNPRNLQGPHYIKIGGETSIHWECDRMKPTPTHVDSYSFYAPRKCVTITTSYRISEEKYWKKDLENAIKGIRKVK